MIKPDPGHTALVRIELPQNVPAWGVLILISLALVWLLEMLRLPAALLLGPMLAAIILVMAGMTFGLSRPLFNLAQAVVGLMIADHLPASVFHEIGGDWLIFLAGTSFTIIASAFLGWLLARSSLLPGTTAIWGSSPGAATVMTLMCEDYGADMRLVAFMQYLRLVCCALSTTLAAFFLGLSGTALKHVDWWGIDSVPFLLVTLGIVGVSPWLAKRLKVPGGALVLSIILGLAIKISGIMPIVLPQWLLAISYAMLGWGIGFRFTRAVLRHAARLFPLILGSILTLIAVNGAFALVLVQWAGVDFLTAFLATSPGGADSVAIIAAATKVNLPFVMAMQVSRFFLVMLAGPLLAQWLSGSKDG